MKGHFPASGHASKDARWWIRLAETRHLDFTDWTWLAPELARRALRPHAASLTGPKRGRATLQRERACIGAMFAQCLKNQPQPLLRGTILKRDQAGTEYIK